jgi:hypothetical protein
MLKEMILDEVPALSEAEAEYAEEAESDVEEEETAAFDPGTITSLSSVGIRKLAKRVADMLRITASAAIIAVIFILSRDLEAASGGE